MIEDRKPRFFYGYVMVAAGFVTSLLMVGTRISFGIFFKPISSELGWTRAMTSGAFSFSGLVFGFLSIIAGRLTDKYGPKVVMVTCGLFLGLGYLLMSQISSIWQFYLFYGIIIGIGMSGVDVPVLSTIARWFVKRRGRATGITKAGAGMGTLILPILASWLISSYGWRNAYVVIGIIVIIGVISAALFLKRDPGQIGQLPDGATEVEERDLNISTHQFSLRGAIGTRQFWTFSGAWFAFFFVVGIIWSHIPSHITDLGISATVAATVISVIGGASIAGRLGMGGVSDRLGNKAAFIIALSLLATSLAWLLFAREVWMFYLFATIYGIAHGSFFGVFSPMVAELFGLRSLGTILGAVFFIGAIGGAISPVIAGYIFDITGGYQPVFLAGLALSIIAIILVLSLRPTSGETARGMYS